MNKLFSILFSLFITLQAYAGHMLFQNIRIDGNIDSIATELSYNGFTIKEKLDDNSMYVMDGMFCGEKCDLYIVSSFDSKTVYKIVIFINNIHDWEYIASKYGTYLNFYYRKYGEPYIAYYNVSEPFKKGDGMEMYALQCDKLQCYTIWTFEEGAITIHIEYDGSISITYEDDLNTKLKDEEDKNFINSEI